MVLKMGNMEYLCGLKGKFLSKFGVLYIEVLCSNWPTIYSEVDMKLYLKYSPIMFPQLT